MDSSSLIYPHDMEKDDRLSKLQLLELGYLDSLQKEDSIVKDETARRLRLQILILEEENDELHEQLALEDDRVDLLECEKIELQAQIEQAELDTQNYHAELRAKDRELGNAKAELLSMNGLSNDSTKLLTEKLSLARELASIKPELEHLRSQASYQQNLLSEKLALQRQVSTLEVELETANAKNASSKRATAKDIASARDTELQAELEELKKELLREKREREKFQKEAERESSEWESRRAVLESKVDAMRTKLRETKEQLKEVQAELAQTIATASKVSVAPESRDAATRARKRGATQMSDTAIGTPDGIAVRGKRGGGKRDKPDQTLLGEKSMFSITPYLNKTINMQPETPKDIEEAIANPGASAESAAVDAENEDVLVENIRAPLPEMDASPSVATKPKSTVKRPKKPALKELSASKNNGLATKKSRVAKLEKVPEEEANENEDPAQNNVSAPIKDIKKPMLQIPVLTLEEAEPKKKKRKLLGLSKTIFDEDDGEATRRPAKVMLAPARSLGKLGGKRDAASSLNAPIAGFGAFSPLKKDKRGAHASFLG